MTGQDGLYNFTLSPEILPSDMPCAKEASKYSLYQLVAVICSVVIICLLSLLEKRIDQTKCCKRPGMIYPVNLLDDSDDTYGFAAAFGSMASHCWNLFWNSTSAYSEVPTWTKSLFVMWNVIFIGVLYYPLFVCLSTQWVLVGSFVGLGYSSFWFWIYLQTILWCPDGADGTLPGENIAVLLPDIVCLCVLMMKFTYVFIRRTILIIRNRSSWNILSEQVGRGHVSTPYTLRYVQQLLVPSCYTPVTEYSGTPTPSLRHKLKYILSRYFYMNDPTFKYSPKVIYIVTVALICAYQFGIIMILIVHQLGKILPTIYNDITNSSAESEFTYQITLGIEVFNYSAIISFVLSSILTLVAIFKILTNYRSNIKKMYKGDFKHLPFGRNTRRPIFILSDSLSYAGSQIAYILWGYVVVFAVLVITCFIFAYMIVLPVFDFISRDNLKFISNLLPGVLILQGLILLQMIFARFLLQRRTALDNTGSETTVAVLALDNRKIYHNVSYFLFFFYIVLGIFGCLLTILKGVILGVFFLARLDKCGLMEGYQTWDTGYMYYTSFLHIEVCHRHPVMLAFCDILIDSVDHHHVHLHNYGSHDSISSLENPTLQRSIPSSSRIYGTRRKAKMRWLKAYTLLRNPGLVKVKIEDEFDRLSDIHGDFDL